MLEGGGGVADYLTPDTRTREQIVGVYATTPDRNPIIEETVPRFENAVGFSGHSFMHTPATGRILAELITKGGQSLVDPGAFSSERSKGESGDGRAFI